MTRLSPSPTPLSHPSNGAVPEVPDVLGSIFRQLHLRAAVTHLGRFCGAWAIDTSGSGRSTFHLVLEGRCWLRHGSDAPVELGAGDLVLLPHDDPHVVSDGPIATAPINAVLPVLLDVPWQGESAVLVCGQMELDPGLAAPLLAALPDFLIFRGEPSAPDPWPQTLVKRALEETRAADAAATIVVERVMDLLFVEAVRHHLKFSPEQTGLFAALSNPKLARALSKIHGKIETPWTVQLLAEVAGMSRSAFASTFQAALGQTPMHYLVRWRLHQAKTWLAERESTVLAVALRAGYRTEAAFVRAFKRELGTTPGAWRGTLTRPQLRRGSHP